MTRIILLLITILLLAGSCAVTDMVFGLSVEIFLLYLNIKLLSF